MSGPADPQVADQVLRLHLRRALVRRQGPAGRAALADPAAVADRGAEFFAGPAPPAVRMEIAEVAYARRARIRHRIGRRATRPGPEAGSRVTAAGLASTTSSRSPTGRPRTPTCTTPRSPGSTDPDLGPVVAYDAAQDPEACRVLLRALLGGARLRARDTEVRFHPTDGRGLSRRPGAAGVHRAAEQHLGDARRRRRCSSCSAGWSWAATSTSRCTTRSTRPGSPTSPGSVRLGRGQLGQRRRHLRRRPGHGGGEAGRRRRRLGPGPGPARGQDAELRRRRRRRSGGRWPRPTTRCATAFPTARGARARGRPTVMKDRLATAAARSPRPCSAYARRAARAASTTWGPRPWTPSGCTATSISARPCTPRTAGRSSTSRASRPRPWPSGVAPDSVWRDVAGMLRSFDYAAASVPGPDSAAWAAECRAAFLRGYAGGEPERDGRGHAARVRGRQGDLRGGLRGAEPSRLGLHPAGRGAPTLAQTEPELEMKE